MDPLDSRPRAFGIDHPNAASIKPHHAEINDSADAPRPCCANSGSQEDAEDDGRLPFQRLDCYVIAREIAARVHLAKISDRELRDQATRAAKSTFLRLSEGLPNEGAAMRRKYFTEANNSLHELLGAMDLAAAIEAVRLDDASTVQRLGARLKMMLRGLLH
jgi:four helix bundle protein